ncbi:Metallo-dependent phosphatase-like [Parasponia andersonii]|uniref:Metallo-dependent phosphatase-like n=1 Tax=Parasponia andersonii TaxID=3476 RepID=A0A2P5BUC8_PARAD|nr:Metallo-dependent phosphatase-like [Parasponia andersonii]
MMISLGDAHVAYQCLDFPLVKLSVVGGRPFSCGGEKLFRKKLVSARYGVEDIDGSAKKICKVALSAPEDHLVILLAHNGPKGLGSNLDDICGKDWLFGGGDHGDADLENAISLLKENSKVSVPLVVFGHMHKVLAHGNGLRKMIVVGADDTIYLNGAIVPRVKTLIDEQGISNSFTKDEARPSLPESEGTKRAFTIVDILDGRVDKISESWVSVDGEKVKLEEELVLFKRND